MTLNSIEVSLLRQLLKETPQDSWDLLTRKDLEAMAKEGGVISVLDQRRFPDKCNQLGIGIGAK